MQRGRGRADVCGIIPGRETGASLRQMCVAHAACSPAGAEAEAARDHLGVMEEGEAEGEGPVAVREAPSQASASQSTTTNLLASVKEQVPPAAPLTPLIGLPVPADPTGIW